MRQEPTQNGEQRAHELTPGRKRKFGFKRSYERFFLEWAAVTFLTPCVPRKNNNALDDLAVEADQQTATEIAPGCTVDWLQI